MKRIPLIVIALCLIALLTGCYWHCGKRVCWYDKTIQHRPVEIRIAQAGPSPFWIEYNGSPLLDEKGRTRYFHSAKEAETAAKELKTPTKK